MKSFQEAFPEVAEEERLKLPLRRWRDIVVASAALDSVTGMNFQLDDGMNMQR